MVYSPNNLSKEEMVSWAAKHYPEVKIRSRVSTNKMAEALCRKTGEPLAAETSMYKLREFMKTDKFKKRLKQAQGGFGFATAVFKGAGY